MEGLRKYLRIALPLLFISYLGCLIAFTHVHIVNGVTIVHSHPYQKNDDGTPKKEHNYAEFQLLHQLSTIQISGAAFAQVLIAAFLATFCVLSTCPVYPDHLRPVLGKVSLLVPASCGETVKEHALSTRCFYGRLLCDLASNVGTRRFCIPTTSYIINF